MSGSQLVRRHDGSTNGNDRSVVAAHDVQSDHHTRINRRSAEGQMKEETGLFRLGLGGQHFAAVHQVIADLMARWRMDFARIRIGAQRGHPGFLGAAAAGGAGLGKSALRVLAS